MPSSKTIARLIFVLILAAYAVYATLYILKTSFVIDGTRYFVLFDDAMISMRYAKNLAHGFGLVWNPGGEHVEGFTNPLWVVYMAFFHLFPIPAEKISLCIQISGAAFVMGSLFFIRSIAEQFTGSRLLALLAVTLTAFYMPLNNWALQGMEVSVLTLMISAAVWLGLRSLRQEKFSPWLYILLGVMTLVRIDMAVPFLAILGFMFLADKPHRRQHLLWGLGVFVVCLGGQTLFRLWYYGDPLPNTYYLKMTGFSTRLRLIRGRFALQQFITDSNWVLMLLPFSLLLFRRDRATLLMFLVILGQITYSLYVGGDAWDHRGGANRYFAIVMPLFFVLFVGAVDRLRQVFVEASGTRWLAAPFLSQFALAAFVLGSMVNLNYMVDNKSLERWTLERKPLFIEGNEAYVRMALAVKQSTTPSARIAVVTAGSIPYFSDRYAIDLLGKSDVKIAHEPAHRINSPYDLESFRPGHMKWDYAYSIGQLKPDVVVQLWGKSEESAPYLKKAYTGASLDGQNTFYFRNGSANVLWDKIPAAP